MTGTALPVRADALAAVAALGEVEVLIIGGGINGCGTFRDLALQEVPALLVDQIDFGAGASMASSRMAHGGLRYLENGEFRLTAEATRERNRLLRNAPHMIRPLPMAIPFFSATGGLWTAACRALGARRSLRERGFVMAEIGLFIYDWFGRLDRSMPLHGAMGRRRARARFPALHPAVRAVSTYYDAVIGAPERIAVELLSDGIAACPASNVLNHCAVESVSNGIVHLVDRIGSVRFSVRPKLVVNAGGAWIDRVNGALGGGRPLIGGTKGSHLVIDHPGLTAGLAGHGWVFDDGNGRVCIAYPMADKVLLGSTDIPVADPDQAECTEEEQAYLLSALRVIFPTLAVGREHVVYRFCGVRPLPRSDAATPGAVSRDHSLVMFEPTSERPFPVLSLVSGKWTTFRAFAEQATDAVLTRLGRTRTVDTVDLAIGGGKNFANSTAVTLAGRYGLAKERALALCARYGSGAEAVCAFLAAGLDRALPGAQTYSDREILRLIRQEMAVEVDDIVLRRTTLAMEGGLSEALLQRLAELLAASSGHVEAAAAAPTT